MAQPWAEGSLLGLEEHRFEVQRIDEQIIDLIQIRVSLAEEILKDKLSIGMTIEDPSQEKRVLKRAEEMARERDLDGRCIREIFDLLIKMNKERQKELLKAGSKIK
jgi:chorismate mutase